MRIQAGSVCRRVLPQVRCESIGGVGMMLFSDRAATATLMPFFRHEDLRTFVEDVAGNRACFGLMARIGPLTVYAEYHGCGPVPRLVDVWRSDRPADALFQYPLPVCSQLQAAAQTWRAR